MVSRDNIEKLLAFLREQAQEFPEPMSRHVIQAYGSDPFYILVSCLLSLRARDTVVIDVVHELFQHIDGPQDVLDMSKQKLENIIESTGFYHQKAKTLRHVSQVLLEEYDGEVPDAYQELVDIKGIGPKTANLVVSEAFKQPAICVDTHVHRIANHLGLVDTDDVEVTQEKLENIIPKEYWREINYLFVSWGQHGCTPQQAECTCPTDILQDC